MIHVRVYLQHSPHHPPYMHELYCIMLSEQQTFCRKYMDSLYFRCLTRESADTDRDHVNYHFTVHTVSCNSSQLCLHFLEALVEIQQRSIISLAINPTCVYTAPPHEFMLRQLQNTVMHAWRSPCRHAGNGLTVMACIICKLIVM